MRNLLVVIHKHLSTHKNSKRPCYEAVRCISWLQINLFNSAFPQCVILSCTTFWGNCFPVSTIVRDGVWHDAVDICLYSTIVENKGENVVLQANVGSNSKHTHF